MKLGLVGLALAVALAGVVLFASLWIEPSSAATPAAASAIPVAAPTAAVVAEGSPPSSISESREATAESGGAARHDPLSQAERLELAVRDELGEEVGDVKLFVLDASGVLQRARTDARGRASFEPRAGACDVFAAPSARAPEHFRLAVGQGAHTLALSAPSAEVSGVVTVDGARPKERLAMALVSARAPFSELELSKELRGELTGASSRTATCDEHGAFAFTGLAPDWSGGLVLPSGYALRRANPTAPFSRQLELERPTSNLRLDLERQPRLLGRAVDAQGAPVAPGARVRGTFHASEGRSTSVREVGVHDRGAFQFALRGDAVERVELVLECEQGRATFEAEGGALERNLDGDIDVGVLVLSPLGALTVLVRDGDGAAVGNAKARIRGEQTWAVSDSDGRITVATSAVGAASLRVVAPGFWAEDVPLVLPTEQEVTVALRVANSLAVRVLDPGGAVVREVQVRLESRGARLFPEANAWWPDDSMVGAVEGRMASGGTEARDAQLPRGWADFAPSPEGWVRLQGLAPGVSIELTILDALEQPLASRGVAPLGVDEQRSVDVALDRALRTLKGRVLDEQGRAVPAAALYLRDGDAEVQHRTGDANGRYEWSGISAREVALRVESRDLAPTVVPRVRLDSTVMELDVVLTAGRRLRVEVADERGAPMTGDRLSARLDGFDHAWNAGYVAPGSYQFRPLPSRALELELVLHGRSYKQTLGSLEESARFVTPVHGSLVVERAAGAQAQVDCVLIRAVDGQLQRTVEIPPDAPEGPLESGPLAPGEYELIFAHRSSGAPPRPVGASARATVSSGQATTVRL